MAELFLLALAISSAAFLEIPSASNFSQKLSMPEVLVFLSLSMNAFPSLSPLKNFRLVESKSVFLLTSEEDVDTKTNFARLKFPVRSGRGPLELSSALFQLGWKLEKHTPFGISMALQLHPSPYRIDPVFRKYKEEFGGRLKMQRGLVFPSYCRVRDVT